MDKRIIIIAASAAFVALVAGGCYLVLHDDNIYLKSLDDEYGCASVLEISNTDDPGTAQPLKEGAVVYPNTTIIGKAMEDVFWEGAPYYDPDRNCVVAQCLWGGDDYVFNMNFRNADENVDVFVSDSSLVIEFTGVKRGFSLVLGLSFDRLPETLVGDWKSESAYGGWFENGEPEYGTLDLSASMSLQKATGLLYRLTFNSKVSYCGWSFGTIFASDFDDAQTLGYINQDGDDLVLTYVQDPGFGTVIRFKSVDAGTTTAEKVSGDSGDVPEPGTSWSAVKANVYDGDSDTDILDRGYRFTMLRDEGDMIFYKVESALGELSFVSVKASLGFWMSAAAIDDGAVRNMAYFEPNVLYTSTYDRGTDDELYSIVYGDQGPVEPMDKSMIGRPYSGTQQSILVQDDKVDNPEITNVFLSFRFQSGNVIAAESEADNVEAKWGMAIQVKKPDGYVFMVEAYATKYGEDYHGYYIGLMESDLRVILLSGALIGEDGEAVAFVQELYPSLRRR